MEDRVTPLGTISTKHLDRLQSMGELDHRTPLKDRNQIPEQRGSRLGCAMPRLVRACAPLSNGVDVRRRKRALEQGMPAVHPGIEETYMRTSCSFSLQP